MDPAALELQRLAHLAVGLAYDVSVGTHLVEIAVEDLALAGEDGERRLAGFDRTEHVDH